jgi:hypothetical protein
MSGTVDNPWLTPGRIEPENVLSPAVMHHPDVPVLEPQPGSVQPPADGLLPGPPVGAPGGWWWLGCHGGAGVDTVLTAAGGGTDAGGYWPVPAWGAAHPVVLVARTHVAGLTAAQRAGQQWAAGAVPAGVELLGLAVVADAPGRLPGPLRELLGLVAAGVPRLWRLPWVDAWRYGAPHEHPVPRPYRALARDLADLTDISQRRQRG